MGRDRELERRAEQARRTYAAALLELRQHHEHDADLTVAVRLDRALSALTVPPWGSG